MADYDQIGLLKAMIWERAKGDLRALAAIERQCSPHDPADRHRRERWRQLSGCVEDFIRRVEDKGLHE